MSDAFRIITGQRPGSPSALNPHNYEMMNATNGESLDVGLMLVTIILIVSIIGLSASYFSHILESRGNSIRAYDRKSGWEK
jgi:hypothetical protein